MKKLHEKVIRRLRSKPTLATPWRGDFTMNISWEVFDLIYHKIVKSNIIKQLWPSVKRENQPVLTLESRTGKRQYFVFNKMNQGGILISRNHLLKKCLGNCAGGVHAVERCEVVVCREKPMRFKYHHSTEVLSFIMVIGIRRSTTLINGYNTSNYDLLPKSAWSICFIACEQAPKWGIGWKEKSASRAGGARYGARKSSIFIFAIDPTWEPVHRLLL